MPIDANDWYGGSDSLILSDSSQVLNPRHRCVFLFPELADRDINLPDARLFARLGWGTGPNVFVLGNYANTYDVIVKDADGGTVGTIPAALAGPKWHWAKIHLVDNSTAAGDWRFQLKTPS